MKANPVKQEIDRRRSITARMLEAFKKNGTLTTAEILKFGNGCSSRLFELRKEGNIIVCHQVQPGFYVYTYKGQKNDTELPENWSEIKRSASEDDESRLAVID